MRSKKYRSLKLLSAILVAIGTTTPALADGAVVVQIRTNFAPLTDFTLVRTTMQSGDPAGQVFIEDHVADVGEDYSAGPRVAELVPVFHDEYQMVVELIDAADSVFAWKRANLTVDQDTTFIVTFTLGGGDYVSHPFFYVTHWTSEEKPPALCRPGRAFRGLRCHGGFCDNIRLDCGLVPGGLGAERWTPFFSDEDGGLQGCATDEVATGLECRGSSCDDIRLRCNRIFGSFISCQETGPISDGDPPVLAEEGFFLRRMSCSGNFCDDKTLEVCSLGPPPWTPQLFYDLCVSVDGWTQGELPLGSALVVAPCRDNLTNDDQRWRLADGGWIENPFAGACVVNGQSGLAVGDCKTEDRPRWIPDLFRLLSAADPKLCLRVSGERQAGERPEEYSPLVLEPCEARADEFWDLPGILSWIFADGFEGGDPSRWSSKVP